MATNDLMSELQKDSIKLDDDSERKVVKMILKLLEDKNGEVQNLAVKWWVPCPPPEPAQDWPTKAPCAECALMLRCTLLPVSPQSLFVGLLIGYDVLSWLQSLSLKIS